MSHSPGTYILAHIILTSIATLSLTVESRFLIEVFIPKREDQLATRSNNLKGKFNHQLLIATRRLFNIA